jgi:hypothetical protein
MALTGKELSALNVLLSSLSVEELVKAAQIGFESAVDKDLTSASSEASMLCSFVLASLRE